MSIKLEDFLKVYESDLFDRAKRLKPKKAPIQLTSEVQTVQFLRSVFSRISFALPAFYLFLGASSHEEPACSIDGDAGVVFRHTIKFSSLNTITLSCRKIFDHARGLTGANFSKNKDATLQNVAEYWANKSNNSLQDALQALKFLQSIFAESAKDESFLLDSTYLLCCRIGLLKQHANRFAAHLSLDDYEFDIFDCAHVVTAITIIGEVIRSFDEPKLGSTYFDELDKASLSMAKQLFPEMPDIRLFQDFEIGDQSYNYWKSNPEQGRQMIFQKLGMRVNRLFQNN